MQKKCGSCGRIMKNGRHDKKYCSHKCRNDYNNKSKKYGRNRRVESVEKQLKELRADFRQLAAIVSEICVQRGLLQRGEPMNQELLRMVKKNAI